MILTHNYYTLLLLLLLLLFTIILSGVQISFRRLTKVGVTSKFWLKLTDANVTVVRLDICQQYNLEILVNFFSIIYSFVCENVEF